MSEVLRTMLLRVDEHFKKDFFVNLAKMLVSTKLSYDVTTLQNYISKLLLQVVIVCMHHDSEKFTKQDSHSC